MNEIEREILDELSTASTQEQVMETIGRLTNEQKTPESAALVTYAGNLLEKYE